MIFLYTLLGLITAIVGSIPLGASNIAVINTTIKDNLKTAMKIALSAGLSEVMLSYYALHYNMMVNAFFKTNQWIQIVVALILLGIGSLLLIAKKSKSAKQIRTVKLINSKYLSGFLLGLLNPPVLIYWLVVYGIINKTVVALTSSTALGILIVFFIGVYSGKVLTLFFYGKFSLFMQQKFNNFSLIFNKITGVLLIIVGLFQFIKVYFI